MLRNKRTHLAFDSISHEMMCVHKLNVLLVPKVGLPHYGKNQKLEEVEGRARSDSMIQ